MLNETDILPDGLLEAKTTDLHELLGAPTLIHLQGERKEPLFISTLLHGNETTGFYAIQRLLKEYQGKALPRSVSLFIGNVEAAAADQRRLDHQPDYNRIWPGSHHDDCAEKDMMKTVFNIMRKRKTFASIDIHNNTGYNPHYACVNILNPHCIQLAGMFGNTVVYFTSPKGVQSAAFSDFCPAVVLECGQSGEAALPIRSTSCRPYSIQKNCPPNTPITSTCFIPSRASPCRKFTHSAPTAAPIST